MKIISEIPYITITNKVKYAFVDIDTFSSNNDFTNEGLEKLDEIVYKYHAKKGSFGLSSRTGIGIYVLKQDAEIVAKLFKDVFDKYTEHI